MLPPYTRRVCPTNRPSRNSSAASAPGDADAARELVSRYEPAVAVRMEVRLRLDDPRLGRVLDSMDICQSVMASFFVRATAGQYDLEQPQDYGQAPLAAMARNKLAFHIRKERAGRRDIRRVEAVSPEEVDAARPEAQPQRRSQRT